MSDAEKIKELILKQVRVYYQFVHKQKQEQPFVSGKSRVNYAGRVYDEKEMINLVDASLEFYLTAGRYDKLFVDKLSTFFKEKTIQDIKALTVNSGSSANLLALSALTSYKLKELALQEGDEVISVAAGFPTTIAPIVQNKLIPVFIDIKLGSYNIDASLIDKAITSKTKAIFVAHTLGIPFDLDEILALAEKHNLWVIEDNCDALGAQYTLSREYKLIAHKKASGTSYTGTIGHIGTSSYYPAHQITMGEGGAVYTYNPLIYKILLSFRDWGRDCWCEPGMDNTCQKRFCWNFGKLPEGYDHKYTYSHIGYNLKVTDMQSAIGCAQLDKLAFFAKKRYENWQKLREGLGGLEKYFILPQCLENTTPSPFGFALTVRKDAGFKRNEITAYLEAANIQTRNIFAGNMLRQPAFTEKNITLRILDSDLISSKDLSEDHYRKIPNTDTVMNDTFFVGVYPGLTEEMIDFIIIKIKEFVKNIHSK